MVNLDLWNRTVGFCQKDERYKERLKHHPNNLAADLLLWLKNAKI